MATQFDALDFDSDEPECLAGVHCFGCGLKNCPMDENGRLMSDEEMDRRIQVGAAPRTGEKDGEENGEKFKGLGSDGVS